MKKVTKSLLSLVLAFALVVTMFAGNVAKAATTTATTVIYVGTVAFDADKITSDAAYKAGFQSYLAKHANDGIIVSSNGTVYDADKILNAPAGQDAYAFAKANVPADAKPVWDGNGDPGIIYVPLSISKVTALTDTKLSVKLSKAVDEAAAANFAIAGVTVTAATLSTEKTEVVLDVKGLEVSKAYTIKATGLKVNAAVQADTTFDYTMPSAQSLFSPVLSFAGDKTVLKADGASSVLVTFTLKDASGNIMNLAEKVEVAFTTTFGNFAEKRVTVQNGVASVMLTSETLTSPKNSIITAQIIEAANKNLIGIQAQKNIVMDPNPDSVAEQTIGATVTEAEAEQADRVILYFNKDVTVSKYAVTGTYAVDSTKASITVTSNVTNAGLNGNVINVLGYLPVPGNTKALYAILDTADADFPLIDNANVRVDFVDRTGTVAVPSTKMFRITDSRKPAMLSVSREGLKTIKVTFSEPVDRASATNPANWVIDGLTLNSRVYGSSSLATATVGTFSSTYGTDTRNVVTITLGKNDYGNQVYFTSGAHSIQGSNIGDWANLSDIGNNVMNTQTLDFAVPVDTTAPSATVTVQSPEQFIITFDKELNRFITGADIKLQVYSATTGTWVDYTKNPFTVTPIGISNTEYKIELNKDWTDTTVYNTNTTLLNYYNNTYRFYIAKEVVSAAANGIKNPELTLLLGGAMTQPDLKSPVINAIDRIMNLDGTFSGSYCVEMDEPIKGFDGLSTLAQGQPNLPTPTAQFVKKDGTVTINAIVSAGIDEYDETLTVTPLTPLTAGDWILVVRSISDDIGNTAASATKDYTVTTTAVTAAPLKAVWAYADEDQDLNVATDSLHANKGLDTNAHDYVYVKFNKAVSLVGDSMNALKTSNYLLDGSALPIGTQIRANITGYDDKDSIVDSITIVLPNGYLNGKNESHVLTISNTIQSTTAGDFITNPGEKKLSWNYYSTIDATSGKISVSTEADLKKYVADDTIREITIAAPITLTSTLTVGRAVDIKGAAITGNVTYSTTNGGIITLSANIAGNLTVNTPNADFVVAAGVIVTGTTTIQDVLTSTFTNYGTLAGVTIQDVNGVRFVNSGVATGVTVDTTGPVTLAGTIPAVTVAKPATVVVAPGATVASMTLASTAAGSLISQASGVSIPLTNNTGADVKVKVGNLEVTVANGATSTVVDTKAPTVTNLYINGHPIAITGGVIDLKGITTDIISAAATLDEDVTALCMGITKTVKTTDIFTTLVPDGRVTRATLDLLDGQTVTITDAAGNATVYTLDTK